MLIRMLIHTIELPFWHQRVRLSASFKDKLAGTEGTLMGPPQVNGMKLGENNVVVSYELKAPVRLDGMANVSMIPMESLILLQPEEHAQAFKID